MEDNLKDTRHKTQESPPWRGRGGFFKTKDKRNKNQENPLQGRGRGGFEKKQISV